MIPKWFLRSRFWYVNLYLDEYVSRDSMAVLLATVLMQIPLYFWGWHVNREHEINSSHIVYQQEFGPKRNRLAHSMIFEEFEMHTEKWKEFCKADN